MEATKVPSSALLEDVLCSVRVYVSGAQLDNKSVGADTMGPEADRVEGAGSLADGTFVLVCVIRTMPLHAR